MTTSEANDTAGRITQAELARRLNVSRPSVSKAVKSGRITPDEDGLFDPVQAELDWLANTRQKAKGITDKGKDASGYAAARARKENALARMAELRLEQAMGNLIDREAVDFVLQDHGAILRSLLESLPDRIAPEIVALRDRESIWQYLNNAFHQLQLDLAGNLERRLLEMGANTKMAP